MTSLLTWLFTPFALFTGFVLVGALLEQGPLALARLLIPASICLAVYAGGLYLAS